MAESAEILWCETLRGAVSTRRGAAPSAPERTRSVTIHVTEAGRSGFFRGPDGDLAELAAGLRFALIEARAGNLPAPPPAHLPAGAPASLRGLFDPTLDGWTPQEAQTALQSWLEPGDRGELRWGAVRVVHATGQGISRRAAATGVQLSILSGRDLGTGSAAGAARTLAELDPAAITRRASERATRETASERPAAPTTFVLSPEASARLIELFAASHLAAEAFHRGTPLSLAHLARTIASPRLSLVDDATDRIGLAFPIDFEGQAKRPVVVLEDGRLLSPAVDPTLAAAHSLAPTSSAFSPEDHRFAHLVVPAGEPTDAELLSAGEGLWISDLSELEWTAADPGRFRARARGIRHVRDGGLGGALPNLRWEADLLEVLRNVTGVGRSRVRVSHDPTFYSGTVCPALRVAAVSGWTFD